MAEGRPRQGVAHDPRRDAGRAHLGVGACAEPAPPTAGDASPSPTTTVPFDGELRCPAGEQDGAVGWDYGANPKGRIEDPARWFQDNAVGLDPELMLSFVEQFRGSEDSLDNVVLAKNEDGLVVAFLEFGRDDEGRYFPNYGAMCASAGIEDFT